MGLWRLLQDPLLSNNMSDIFPFFYGAAYTHSKEFPNVQICLFAKQL